MCHYKLLAHNHHGYVIRCHNCKHYQLAFGTSAVTFKASDYAVFKKQLRFHSKSSVPDGFEQQKSISIELFSRSSAMVLTHSELLNLNELIEEACFNENLSSLFEDLNLSAG